MARGLAVAALCLAMSSCGLFKSDTPPPSEVEIKPPPPEAVLDMVIQASPLANPDASGTPSPIVVRVYQLSAQEAFAGASFFQLWEKDAETLGPSLIGKYETSMQPAGVVRVKAKLDTKALMIGVVAGYRNFKEAKWRALTALHGEQKFSVKVELKSAGVAIGPQD